jgi:hypothetical protein
MGIVGTVAMIAYSSWKENQIKILDGKEIIESYPKVRNKFLGYFKNVETGESLENPRTDIVSTVSTSFREELVLRLKANTVSKDNVKNALDFLLDTPAEYCYAILAPLRSLVEFTSNENIREGLLLSEELKLKLREARLAKEAYLKAKKEKEDEVPF